MNLTDDKYDHHEEEIQELNSKVDKLERKLETVTAVALVGFTLAIESSEPKYIKDTLEKVLQRYTLSKRNRKFIKKLLQKAKYSSKNNDYL